VVDDRTPSQWAQDPGTIDDLIQDARALRFTATKRMIYDWVGLGLLDHPVRRTRGDGGSDKALWSPKQRNLFRILVMKRPQARRIWQLCQFPILFWLDFGTEYVPTSQAALAMQTWAHQNSSPSVRASRESARQILRLLDQPDTDSAARRHLVDVVARATYELSFDRAEMLDAVWAVFDRGDKGRRLGVPPAEITPEQFVDFMMVRLSALKVARTVTEQQLAVVWHANQMARPGWESDRPEMERRVTREVERELFKEETPQDRFEQAPTIVLTLLGTFFGDKGEDHAARHD
jgi:hypothetical protein